LKNNQKICVIGGGIIGLAIAHKLSLKYSKSDITLFEKESSVGSHQSGNNSGVLHCGLHYVPGSLKAELSVNGIEQMINFCRQHEIDHELCGKIVVATNDREIAGIDELARRGQKNGLKGLKFLNNKELQQREPNVKGVKTLLVPQEGIINYKKVTAKLKQLLENSGVNILVNQEVKSLKSNKDNKSIVRTDNFEESFDVVINCTGLFSDRMYRKLTGIKSPIKIVPFRGEYMHLSPEFYGLFNHLVYPVPDPVYPFLGIHFTRLIEGGREVGPNAVLAFKREGYRNIDFSFTDFFDSLTYEGLRKFIFKNFTYSLGELQSSILPSKFVANAQKMIPDLRETMFEKKGTAGVRAQAITKEGELLNDFKIIREGNQIHVLNAPSPGATASFAIADHIIRTFI
jgi:(S)-2-hydroxyglutarate dehydrogenase